MSLAVLHSRALSGLDAPEVTVEVHLANGLPSFTIVGLPDTEVKESRDRVRAALVNSRFDFPARRITVNLAPAELPKESGRFDLPIALGILAASHQLEADGFSKYEFAGELSLTGELRQVIARASIYQAGSLLDVCAHLAGRQPLSRPAAQPIVIPPNYPDLAEVKGQAHAKRALEVAAAGSHSVLMVGPPGTGKSMLAARFAGLLPPMSGEEALESAALASLGSGGFRLENWKQRPFRAPHHSASGVALVGGGSDPRPGEISLAHNGVLFLDELPEFDRKVLEALREPLESGRVAISRAARQAEYPARFQLIGAMNPCPCGYLGHFSGKCRCTPDQVIRYRHKLSGPFLDRIDIQIEVPAVREDELVHAGRGENSARVRERVERAHERQLARQGKSNARLGPREIERFCTAEERAGALLRQAIGKLHLSARAYHRVLKLSRTIADLAGEATIAVAHVAEAIQYRRLERSF